jgi:tetratricopeptide (TPR) repeat protein
LRINLLIVFFILLLCLSGHVYSQNDYDKKSVQNNESVRRVEFIVRKGDYVSTIAARIRVSVHEIVKINKLHSKNYLAYPGRRLIIPVPVQTHVWDPTKEDMTGNSPSREDRGGTEDYELLIDSGNYSLIDDFIDLTAARSDSIEYDHISSHLRKIEKHISYLQYRIDSIKQVDFKFDYEDQDKNSILSKMKMSRDKYYAEGPLGRQIDSLRTTQSWLGQRRIVLSNQITEYEYLVDNASYSEHTFKHDEKDKPSDWGSHLAYESIYLKSRNDAAHQKTNAPEAKNETVAATPDIIDKKTIAAQTVITPSISHPAPAVHAKVDSIVPESATISREPTTATATNNNNIQTSVSTSRKVDNTQSETIVQPKVLLPAKTVKSDNSQPVAIADVKVSQLTRDITPAATVNTTAVSTNPTIKIMESEDVRSTEVTSEYDEIPAHYKSDFALLPKQKFISEIWHKFSAGESLQILSLEAISTNKPIIMAKSPVVEVKESPTPLTTNKATLAAVKDQTTSITKTTKDSTSKDITLAKITPKPAVSSVAVAKAPANIKVDKDTSKKNQKVVKVVESLIHKTDTIRKTPKPTKEVPTKKSGLATADTSAQSHSAKQTKTKDTLAQKPQTELRHDAMATEKHVVINDTVKEKPNPQITFESAPSAKIMNIASSDQPVLTLESKIDTTIERRAPEINQDPLSSYKTDSDFIAKKDVQIKDIPIAEYKNRPKYLIPADSVNKIKGDFYLIRARQVLEKGDFKTGEKYLRKSLDLDPNNSLAWMLHADLFLTMGLADQALKEYTISSEIDSTNPKIFYNIALLFTKANNNQKAYKYFSKSIEVSSKYLLAYMGRASLLMSERDYEGAIQDYDKVLQANKYYSPAFKARGLAKMEVRKFTEAIQDFNQYLEIEDPDGFVIFQRGLSKIYSNNLLQGCLDLSSANELGFKEAEKAIKKFCE